MRKKMKGEHRTAIQMFYDALKAVDGCKSLNDYALRSKFTWKTAKAMLIQLQEWKLVKIEEQTPTLTADGYTIKMVFDKNE